MSLCRDLGFPRLDVSSTVWKISFTPATFTQRDRETERQRDREKVRQRDRKIITCITWLGFWVVCRSVDDHNYKETKV